MEQDEFDHNRSYGGYDSILRQRLSSVSSESGSASMGESPPVSNPLRKMMEDEIKMADPTEKIPLHWKVIPMPWKS